MSKKMLFLFFLPLSLGINSVLYSIPQTDFVLAAGAGNLEKMKELLEQSDVKINGMGEVRLFAGLTTALSNAAVNNRKAIVQWLLDNGAKVDHPDSQGYTPLQRATQKAKKDTGLDSITYLINKGANVNAQVPKKVVSFGGFTPLHFAAGRENKKMVKFLLEKGANPTIKNTKERTAFDITYDEEIKEILTTAKVPTTAKEAERKRKAEAEERKRRVEVEARRKAEEERKRKEAERKRREAVKSYKKPKPQLETNLKQLETNLRNLAGALK